MSCDHTQSSSRVWNNNNNNPTASPLVVGSSVASQVPTRVGGLAGEARS